MSEFWVYPLHLRLRNTKNEEEAGGCGGAKIWVPVEPWQENILIDVSSMGLRDFLHICDLLEDRHVIILNYAKDVAFYII